MKKAPPVRSFLRKLLVAIFATAGFAFATNAPPTQNGSNRASPPIATGQSNTTAVVAVSNTDIPILTNPVGRDVVSVTSKTAVACEFAINQMGDKIGYSGAIPWHRCTRLTNTVALTMNSVQVAGFEEVPAPELA